MWFLALPMRVRGSRPEGRLRTTLMSLRRFEAVELKVEFACERAALLLPAVDCVQCLVEVLELFAQDAAFVVEFLAPVAYVEWGRGLGRAVARACGEGRIPVCSRGLRGHQ
jgi:hypothetical protein